MRAALPLLADQGERIMNIRRSFPISAAAAALFLAGCGATDGTVTKDGGTVTPPKDGGTTVARPVPPGEGVTASGDTIKIGLVASVTGDNKPWGVDSIDGAKMAVDEFNAAGGYNGKKVEMLMEDSASKQDQAQIAAEKLLSDGVIAIVGEVSSGNTIQIAKSAFQRAVPVMAIGATRTDLTAIGNNVFRVCYTDDFQGPVVAKFAYDKLGLRKLAVMTDNNLPYSQGLSKSFMDTFKKLGGEIVAEAFYMSGGKEAPQYSGQLTEIKAKNPDGLFLSGYFTEVGPISQQARGAGIKATLLGGDGWDSPTILTSGGDSIIGGYFCNHYNNADNRPQVTEFLDKWKKSHKGELPNTTMGALGYDAMAITLNALKNSATANSKAITEALEATENFAGVSGDIKLKGQNGNPPKRAIIVEVTKGGPADFQKFAFAYTPDQI